MKINHQNNLWMVSIDHLVNFDAFWCFLYYFFMKKLLEIKRNNVVERVHFGYVGLYDADFGFVSPSLTKENFYMRSCMKPLQASVLDSLGAFDGFSFNEEEIAIMCASHTGSQYHVDLVENILKKINLAPSFLQCGAHFPLDFEEAFLMKKNGFSPQNIHNNCSGKHAGFLAGCVIQGFDVQNYLEFSHPLQKKIKERVFDYCHLFEMEELVSKDGCGAPIWAMPLSNMAQGFLNCFKNHKKITEAMRKFPYAAGGHNRIDSEITNCSKGKLIAKVGAEGLLMIYNTSLSQVFVVKVLDANEPARAIVAIDGLLALGWIDFENLISSPLMEFYKLEVNTLSKEKVGNIKICFDWNLLK